MCVVSSKMEVLSEELGVPGVVTPPPISSQGVTICTAFQVSRSVLSFSIRRIFFLLVLSTTVLSDAKKATPVTQT